MHVSLECVAPSEKNTRERSDVTAVTVWIMALVATALLIQYLGSAAVEECIRWENESSMGTTS